MVRLVQVRKGLGKGLVHPWRRTGAGKSIVVEKCSETGMVRLAHWCRLLEVVGKCCQTTLVRMVHLAQTKIRPKTHHPLHPWCAHPSHGAKKSIFFVAIYCNTSFLVYNIDS